jgi:hypothetical protein
LIAHEYIDALGDVESRPTHGHDGALGIQSRGLTHRQSWSCLRGSWAGRGG